jgi:hypothetical protein
VALEELAVLVAQGRQLVLITQVAPVASAARTLEAVGHLEAQHRPATQAMGMAAVVPVLREVASEAPATPAAAMGQHLAAVTAAAVVAHTSPARQAEPGSLVLSRSHTQEVALPQRTVV